MLATEMPHSGSLGGKGLLTLVGRMVCRQPCAGCQPCEGPPWLWLRSKLLDLVRTLPGVPASGAI